MVRSVVQSIYQDNKGRAVAVMVLDCTVTELSARIAESPIAIDAYTLEQLKQAKALEQPKQKAVGGKLSKWLGQRERDKPFQQFLQKKYGRNATDPKTAEIAVKDIVGFASRTQLDNDVELGMRFKKMIMMEFNAWLNS
jgi:hypothetical protein